jgi:uncharacterized protein with ParB-like and HNH nuclease domain
MVFEVINDRGVRLKPHEILKGKLLGQIDKSELAAGRFNELWDGQVESLNRFWRRHHRWLFSVKAKSQVR